MNKTRAVEHITGQPWGITKDALGQIVSIAERTNESPEAVAAKLGRPLENTRRATVRDGVAIVPVIGPIFRYANLFTDISGATSIQTLATDFRQALEDESVTAIVLEIDSPGGTVAGTNEFSKQVRDARGIKPIIAYSSNLMASAAYWIGSAADQIVIEETAAVGSIGVVTAVPAKKDKERIEIVSSNAPDKRIDTSKKSGRQKVLAHLDKLEAIFIESVASNRGVDEETVLSDFGQGGLLVGEEAVEAGMADAVGTLESVIAGLSGQPENFTMNKTVNADGPEINRSYLAENHPELVASLKKEGAEEATSKLNAEHATALLNAKDEGATAERERIQSVLSVKRPGHEALIEGLAFDGKTTGPEAAMKVIQAENEAHTSHLKGMADDAPAPVEQDARDGDSVQQMDAKAIAVEAQKYQREQAAAGVTISVAQAVKHVTNQINQGE